MSKKPFDEANPPPWYKQFWPWFIMSIPAGTIVAAMFTINIAIESDDGLVSEDYYKEGLGIHRNAAALTKARELGIEADIRFDLQNKTVKAEVVSTKNQAYGNVLELAMRFPTKADRDSLVTLTPAGPGVFTADLPGVTPHAWNVHISSSDGGWQLHGRADLSSSDGVLLK